ncbi:MAG: hypothetical protein ACP5I4_07970 [Oceanipulchritudo sp.]
MKTILKRLLILIAATALATLTFSGCQTADGLGQDIENLGESIQD